MKVGPAICICASVLLSACDDGAGGDLRITQQGTTIRNFEQVSTCMETLAKNDRHVVRVDRSPVQLVITAGGGMEIYEAKAVDGHVLVTVIANKEFGGPIAQLKRPWSDCL